MFIELDDQLVKDLARYECKAAIHDASVLALQQDQNWWKEKIAFAEGKVIQCLLRGTEIWNDTTEPSWKADFKYRIKPEKKLDVVSWIVDTDTGLHESAFMLQRSAQAKVVRDGETGALKSVELCK